jgi:L-seryl-tRNA(Ser) seleniumtransferase
MELPEVRRAVEEASHHFVDMFELQRAAGKRLAELSGAESGMVTSGSAGSIASATAACIAGTDPKLIWQLPDTTGLKNRVVLLGGRNPFDSAIRLVGAQLVIASTVDDLPSAIDSQTAMVYTTFRDERLVNTIKITRAKGVPILVDHAAGIPPYDNFTRYAKMGGRSLLFQRWEGRVRPAVFRRVVGPERSHRCCSGKQQSLGGGRMQAHESREGRDYRHTCGDRVLVAGGSCGFKQGVAEPGGTYRQAG